MVDYKMGDIVKIIHHGSHPYNKEKWDNDIPVGLITETLLVSEDGSGITRGAFRGWGVDWILVIVDVCGILGVRKHVYNITKVEKVRDKYKKFLYHMNGPYIDE